MMKDRIARLEIENRWLKRLVAFSIAAALLPWALGGKPFIQHEVRAEQFTLVGSDGKPRGMWMTGDNDNDNRTILAFSSAPGKPRVVLVTTSDFAKVQIECKDGSRAELGGNEQAGYVATLKNREIVWQNGR